MIEENREVIQKIFTWSISGNKTTIFLARTVFMSERYLEFLSCQSLPTEILNIPWSLVEVAEIT